MRKLLLLLTLIAVVFIALNRQRLYLRDPLGHATRDGVALPNAAVFINESNDVLLQLGTGPVIDQYLVQHWNLVPSFPAEMRCLRGLVCLAQADQAPAVQLPASPPAVMTNRSVTFQTEAHQTLIITLR